MDGTLSRRCPRAPNCRFCHCGQHLVEMADTTRGPAAADIAARMRAWILARASPVEGIAFLALEVQQDPCRSQDTLAHGNWGVPLNAPEVLLVEPKVAGGTYSVVVRPCEASFFLCRAKSRAICKRSLPTARRQP